MFAAGGETSAMAVDWAMTEITKNLRVMKKAQDEVRQVFIRNGLVDKTCISKMKYLNCVVTEMLRLHPVVPLLLPR